MAEHLFILLLTVCVIQTKYLSSATGHSSIAKRLAATSSSCSDNIPNCPAYGHSVCRGPYEAWAKQNCAMYCKFCESGLPTAISPCVDKLRNCAAYGHSACIGQYEPWARINCRKTCGYCLYGLPTTIPPCVDKLRNCAAYDHSACIGQYELWARSNCRKTCGYCLYGPGINTSTTVVSGWTMLMKGVAGAPGDLFDLWSSVNTQNQNTHTAADLTNRYLGHFKPDLSNHWHSLNITKVKVAVYNSGVEKAYIIFDARGAGKMDWFQEDRILSSSWDDIKGASTDYFYMEGNPQAGREFYISQKDNGCHGYGWMMVATQSLCPYEQAIRKPAFLYSSTKEVARWENGQVGSGDVFLILAQGGHLGQSVHTTASGTDFCVYKGLHYATGQSWVDGCDYNCTCVDGKSGHYTCNSVCPYYSRIPPTCILLNHLPGECCRRLTCSTATLKKRRDYMMN